MTSKKTGKEQGHKVRLAWLRSLEAGSDVLVYRPAYTRSASWQGRLDRPEVREFGKIASRNRVSVCVDWKERSRIVGGHDSASETMRAVENSFDCDVTLPGVRCRKTKLPSTGLQAGISPESDCRNNSFGVCIFPDEAHLQEHLAVLERLKSVRASNLVTPHAFKSGTTLEELETLLSAWAVCFGAGLVTW